MTRRRNPGLYQVSTLSLTDLVRLTGWTRHRTIQRLIRNRSAPYCTPDQHGRYDRRVLDLLRVLYGQPDDFPDEPAQDWLSDYLRRTSR